MFLTVLVGKNVLCYRLWGALCFSDVLYERFTCCTCHAIIHLGGGTSLSLIWAAPHYLAVAPWPCETCPTECFVSQPSGAWSHLSLLPRAKTCFNPDTASYTGEQSKGKPPNTNVLLYILSHSIAEALSIHNRPSFKNAEHPLRAWQGAD